MVKLCHLKVYNLQDVPDYIVEQVEMACDELSSSLGPIMNKYDSNIVLAAICFLHAVVIKETVAEEEVSKCALMQADALIKNTHMCQDVSEMIKNGEIGPEEIHGS